MRFVKKDYHCEFPLCFDDSVEIRVNTPQDNGSVHVSFAKISSKELSKKVLDPHVVTLTRLIENNEVLQPGNVSTLLDPTDQQTLENNVSEVAENVFKDITEDPLYDKKNNRLIKPEKEESES